MNLEKDEIIKNEILLEAQKLFQQYGLKKTTMDEIAAACGKAKSTLYYYFKNKEEVFDEVVLMEMVNLRRSVKNSVEEHKLMTDKISTYIIEFHKQVVSKVNLYRIIKQDQHFEAIAKKHFLKMMQFEKSYITRILEDGFDAGELKEAKREELGWMAEMFLASFFGIVQYGIDKDGFYDEEKMAEFANMIVPRLFY